MHFRTFGAFMWFLLLPAIFGKIQALRVTQTYA